MRNDRPGRSRQRRIDRGLPSHHGLCDRDGQVEFALPEEIFGNGGQHGHRFRMFRVGVSEPQSAIEITLVPGGLRGTLQGFLMFAIGKYRGVRGFGRFLVERIGVSRLLIFVGGARIIATLVENLGQQEIRVRAVRFAGEVVQPLAIPLRRFDVIALTLVRLCLRVVVLGKIVQVLFERSLDGGVLFTWITLPERAVHAITLDEALLALEDERRETAAFVGLDHLDLQQRRLRVVRILRDKRLVGFCRVLEAFLLQVEVAQRHVDDVAVVRITALVQEGGNALRAVHVREADAQHAEGIFNQLPVRATEVVEPRIAVLQLDVTDLAIE